MQSFGIQQNLLDPQTVIADGFIPYRLTGSFTANQNLNEIVAELLNYERDQRFKEAHDILVETFDVPTIDRGDVLISLDESCGSMQRTLLLQALRADGSEDHMVLIGILETLRTAMDMDTPKALAAACAFAARLHEYGIREMEKLTPVLLREAALCEYLIYESTGKTLDRHPDMMAPVEIRADMRVFGAVLSYYRYDIPLESGALLANESISDFKEITTSYIDKNNVSEL